MIQTKDDPANFLQMTRLSQAQRVEKMVVLLNTIKPHLGNQMSAADIRVLMHNSICTTASIHQLTKEDIDAMDLPEAAKNSFRSLSVPPQGCEPLGCLESSSYLLIPSTP